MPLSCHAPCPPGTGCDHDHHSVQAAPHSSPTLSHKSHCSSCLCLQAAERALDLEEAVLCESAGELAHGNAAPPPLQRRVWPADELVLSRGGLEACECGTP